MPLALSTRELGTRHVLQALYQIFTLTMNYTKLVYSNFRSIFHFSTRKNSHMDLKSFLEWVQSNSRSKGSTSTRQETWRNSRTARAFDWTDQFSRMWKTSFTILIGRILFYLCEKHRPLLWLARTHLRMKMYDIARLCVYPCNSGKLKTRSRCKFFLYYIYNKQVFHLEKLLRA